jgi:halimadienyl-diphosphate synthase
LDEELARASDQVIKDLLAGTMSETVYGTAIVSHLRSPDDPRRLAFPDTLEWLRKHQHPGGSWGGCIEIPHDRIVSTLAAVTRLAELPEE